MQIRVKVSAGGEVIWEHRVMVSAGGVVWEYRVMVSVGGVVWEYRAKPLENFTNLKKAYDSMLL